jgi:hypothetical protein
MPRACQVTFEDLDGVKHTVLVEADSAAWLSARCGRAGIEGSERIDQSQHLSGCIIRNPSKHREIS